MLPFTLEQFLNVFATYNKAIWPAQIAAYVLGTIAVAALLRPRAVPLTASSQPSSDLCGCALAFYITASSSHR